MSSRLHSTAIEVWETLRQAVVERTPAAAEAMAERVAADWRRIMPRDRGAIALACALNMNLASPGGRRQARQILSDFEREGLLPDPDRPAMLSEEPSLSYHDLSDTKRRQLAQDLEWVIAAGFVPAVEAASGPVAAMGLVEKRTHALRGAKAARFLAELGYPIAVPDKPRRRWLHRFGMIDSLDDTAPHRQQAVRAMCDFAMEAGASIGELDTALGFFTGAERSAEHAAFCGAAPSCRPCPLRRLCHYGRFLESHGKLADEPREGGRRKLAEAFLPEDRPREKLASQGAEALTNAELLAILLRTGTEKEHAVELANRVLRTAGSLDRLARHSIQELTSIPGLGPVKAITIKAALELARRLAAHRPGEDAPVTGARDVFERMRGFYLEKHKEVFVGLLLNTKNRIIRQVVISEGTLNQSLVHPREAFQDAVRDSAACIIFVHNHPSGDPTPSRDDKAITERLVDAGEIMCVRVLDHIIIGRERYYSFADDGKLKGTRG